MHVTHKDALRQLDALVQLAVISVTETAPPAAPDAGAAYLVPVGASGEWASASEGASLPLRMGRSKSSRLGRVGALNRKSGRLLVFGSAGYAPLAGQFGRVALNAVADGTHRRATCVSAVLLSHDGGDYR